MTKWGNIKGISDTAQVSIIYDFLHCILVERYPIFQIFKQHGATCKIYWRIEELKISEMWSTNQKKVNLQSENLKEMQFDHF